MNIIKFLFHCFFPRRTFSVQLPEAQTEGTTPLCLLIKIIYRWFVVVLKPWNPFWLSQWSKPLPSAHRCPSLGCSWAAAACENEMQTWLQIQATGFVAAEWYIRRNLPTEAHPPWAGTDICYDKQTKFLFASSKLGITSHTSNHVTSPSLDATLPTLHPPTLNLYSHKPLSPSLSPSMVHLPFRSQRQLRESKSGQVQRTREDLLQRSTKESGKKRKSLRQKYWENGFI